MPKGILQLQGTIRDADRVKQIGRQFDELNKEHKGRTSADGLNGRRRCCTRRLSLTI